jgi:hypothetical protein
MFRLLSHPKDCLKKAKIRATESDKMIYIYIYIYIYLSHIMGAEPGHPKSRTTCIAETKIQEPNSWIFVPFS